MKVRWTPASKITYLKVIAYLDEFWSKRELQNFVDIVENVINQIIDEPYMFEASRKKYISAKVLLPNILPFIIG